MIRRAPTSTWATSRTGRGGRASGGRWRRGASPLTSSWTTVRLCRLMGTPLCVASECHRRLGAPVVARAAAWLRLLHHTRVGQ